jgi:hypothetical protein
MPNPSTAAHRHGCNGGSDGSPKSAGRATLESLGALRRDFLEQRVELDEHVPPLLPESTRNSIDHTLLEIQEATRIGDSSGAQRHDALSVQRTLKLSSRGR